MHGRTRVEGQEIRKTKAEFNTKLFSSPQNTKIMSRSSNVFGIHACSKKLSAQEFSER